MENEERIFDEYSVHYKCLRGAIQKIRHIFLTLS